MRSQEPFFLIWFSFFSDEAVAELPEHPLASLFRWSTLERSLQANSANPAVSWRWIPVRVAISEVDLCRVDR